MVRKGKKRSPICLTGAANLSFTTSCSARIGRRAAKAARMWPITSMAQTGICRSGTSPLSRFRARHSPSWKRTKSAWVGASNGCHRTGNDFNFDYHVSFTKEDDEKNKVYYNYRTGEFISGELPGLSVFYKNEDGDIFHTYSTYARGLDILMGTYNFLDLVPKGRDENPDSPMDWVRRHDQYAS